MAGIQPDERLCIWCGQEYKASDRGADQCFCTTCRRAIAEASLGAVRAEWLRLRPAGNYADVGQPKDRPWPPSFPVQSRSAGSRPKLSAIL